MNSRKVSILMKFELLSTNVCRSYFLVLYVMQGYIKVIKSMVHYCNKFLSIVYI